MLCPNCEAVNRDGAHFCDECGFPLDGAKNYYVRVPKPEVEGDLSESEPEPESEPAPEPETAEEVHDDSSNDVTIALGDELSVPHYGEPLDRVPEIHADATTYDDRGYDRIVADPTQRIDATMELPRIDQQQPAQNRDYRLVNDVPKRGGAKKVIIALVIILALAGIAAGVTYALGIWGGVVVPEVVGLEETEAVAELENAGFTVRTTQVKSDETEGLVLLTDPEGGARAPKESEVVVHIATMRTIPEIVGTTKDQAEELLNEEGYTLVQFVTEKSNEEEDIVLSVSPDEGERAKSTTEIVVTISEAYRVPSVNGLDVESAEIAISDEGLTPEIVYIDTDQFPDGTVISVQPEAGTKVSSGDYVTLSVARARGIELEALTEALFTKGSTVTVGGVSYEVESLISTSYQGNDTVAFTATGRPKITFFGETLYASTSQTFAGTVVWSENNEVVSIS